MNSYSENSNSIVVTGIGMVTPLGNDADTSCAAFRAGLTRANSLEHAIKVRLKDGDEEDIVAHSIPIVTCGFRGFARLLQLSLHALQDLERHSKLHRLDHKRTGIYLAYPDLNRIRHSISRENNSEIEDFTQDMEESTSIHQESIGHRLCKRITEQVNLSIPEENWKGFCAGRTGVSYAIADAIGNLNEKKLDYCLIGGIDSFLEEKTLHWLHNTGRLKTSENPYGFHPGEAGAFLLAERYKTAVQRGASILLTIVDVARGVEQNHLFTGQDSSSEGLTKAVNQVLSTTNIKQNDFWFIGDQNGEKYWITDWTNALLRISGNFSGILDTPVWLPSMAFGEIGTASGAVAICLASNAFSRNYAPSDFVVIQSSSDMGERSAMLLMNFNN